MKKLLLASALLLAGCAPAPDSPLWVPQDRCHLNVEALSFSQLGYFEGKEAYDYLAPLNIRRDKRGEKPINLQIFTLWVNMDTQSALIVDGCRLVELDFEEALTALVKK